VNLPKYEMYLKLMIDGISSSPFSAKGLPPLADNEKTGNAQPVIDYSREHYASDKTSVEEKIMSWHENTGEEGIPTPVLASTSAYRPAAVASRPAPASSAPVSAAVPASLNTPIITKKEFKNSVSNSVPTSAPASVSASTPASTPTVVSTFPPRPDSRKITLGSYKAICSSCGQATTTIFEPDGVRPVYCRDCLSKKKEEKRQELAQRQLAKIDERRRVDEEEKKKESVPTLSLNDLKNVALRDFRGREIKMRPAPGVRPSPFGSGVKTPYKEQEISEGENITLKN
ncbi:MAG: hypothetical protein Q8N57_04070, partial [bacterium]|nr:hypothetical protein [bacterium]